MPLEYDPTRTALYHPEQRETLFEAGRDYTLLQVGIEAARLAYYRAEVDAQQLQRLKEALGRVGFGEVTLFVAPGTGSYAFGAWRASDGVALIAFRGTQPDNLRDLGTDVDVRPVPWTHGVGGTVHKGFSDADLSVAEKIDSWLRGEPRRCTQLTLCGHSLGAALATLCASIWRPKLLVSLGGPRVGDEAFVRGLQGLQGLTLERLVNCCDLVTRVPPALLDYQHPPAFTYIASDAARHATPEEAFVDTDCEKVRLRYLRQHAWRTGNVSLRDLADHAPINYARAFFPDA